MQLSELDLRALTVPGLAAIVAAVVLFATWHYAGEWVRDSEREYRQARSALTSAARQYREASDDQDVYVRYASRFTELGDLGWIGREQRLSWIENLQDINSELRLPTLRYDIEQQQRAEIGGVRVPARMDLRQSPMRLRIGALHEGDVLALLERMRAEGSGLMVVSQCRFDRVGDGPDIRIGPRQANIDATCDLHWYTLRLEPE